METRREERIGQLLQELKRSDKLHLKDAAALLGVSEMTIRRDLNNHSAPVVLLGGYIVLEPRSASHYLLSDQKSTVWWCHSQKRGSDRVLPESQPVLPPPCLGFRR